MDSAALLDLLGNKNRRRILRLLARKSCYVTEISEYLGVSPKAVIEHLRKLEEAGLIESRTDEKRRKYFHIARNLRLEVNVSPYAFGTKSAYAASKSLDISTCRHLTINVQGDPDDGADPAALAAKLQRLEQLENELSLAQRWVQGRLTDVLDSLTDSLDDGEFDSRLYADVLVALSDGPKNLPTLSRQLDAPPPLVEEVLAEMADGDLVRWSEEGWALNE